MKDLKIKIRLEEKKDYKRKFVEKVLRDLPDWFGIEEAILAYGKEARELDTYIISLNKEDLGFLIIKETSPYTIELYCLGLFAKSRGQGLGRILVDEVLNLYREKFMFCQVKTLDEGIDKHYDKTIGFYKSLGFMKMETIKEIWGEDNPCMIMIKSL